MKNKLLTFTTFSLLFFGCFDYPKDNCETKEISQQEICGNGIDDDCDGLIDEEISKEILVEAYNASLECLDFYSCDTSGLNFKWKDFGYPCNKGKCDHFGHCGPVHCLNEIKDIVESDIDCGSNSDCSLCLNGKKCLLNSDCQSNNCISNICQ